MRNQRYQKAKQKFAQRNLKLITKMMEDLNYEKLKLTIENEMGSYDSLKTIRQEFHRQRYIIVGRKYMLNCKGLG